MIAENSEEAIEKVKDYIRKEVDNLNDFFKYDDILIVCMEDIYGKQYQYKIYRDEVENRVSLRK